MADFTGIGSAHAPSIKLSPFIKGKSLTLFNKSKENPSKTITANRISRSEGIFFKFLYMCHKILTYVFTGKLIRFGNYSFLPKAHAIKLAKEACIWSSFTGSVTKIINDHNSSIIFNSINGGAKVEISMPKYYD